MNTQSFTALAGISLLLAGCAPFGGEEEKPQIDCNRSVITVSTAAGQMQSFTSKNGALLGVNTFDSGELTDNAKRTFRIAGTYTLNSDGTIANGSGMLTGVDHPTYNYAYAFGAGEVKLVRVEKPFGC